MSASRIPKTLLAPLVLSGLLLSPPARATLGCDRASVLNLQARTRAAMRVTHAERYQLHELRLPTTTVVREYVAHDGKVFAVAWQGPWRPDLRVLLGDYYPRYVQAVRAQRGRRGPVTVRLPGLVVELSGHTRAWYGRAYAPDALPVGLRAEEIR